MRHNLFVTYFGDGINTTQGDHMKTSYGRTALASLAAFALVAGTAQVAVAAAKAGGTCKKVGAKEGAFTCVTKGRKKVWAATPAAAVTATTVAASAGATPAPAPAGLKEGPGFDGKTISIAYLGNVAGGPFASGGKALTAGFNSVVADVNAAGGIAGKYKLNNIFAETGYNPEITAQKYAELKDKVVMVGQIYGTPNVQALLPKLAQDNIVGSPISLDAEWAQNPNLLPVGGAYQYQAINVVDWAFAQAANKGKTICAVAHTGPYGEAGVEGYNLATKKLALKTGPTIRIAPAEPNMAAVVSQLKGANCEVVFLGESSGQTTGILVNGSQNGYNPTLIGLAPSFDIKQVTNATEALYNKQFFVGTDGVQWADAAIPGMKDMLASVRRNAPQYAGDVNGAYMWGYVQARAVVAVLTKAVEKNDLSRDGIKAAMAETGKVNQGGLYPEFDYVAIGKRVPSAVTNIMRVDVATPGGLTYQSKSFESPLTKEYKHAKWA
jgi:ABC-type branched-subunit amino acid transport system substrate-binding protein